MAFLFNYFNQLLTIIPLFQCLVSSQPIGTDIGQLSLQMPILEYVIYNPNPQISIALPLPKILAIVIIAQLETLLYRAQQTVKLYK